jgi:signal transduction histidine kinase
MQKGTTVLRKRPRKTRHSWHLLYYLLATFNILTLTYSVYLNGQSHAAFNRSVEHGQLWHARFEGFNELFQLANEIKAPLDQVFQDGDVTGARTEMTAAHDRFGEHLSDKLRDLTEEAELIQVKGLMEGVNKARVAIDRVESLSHSFLDDYGKVELPVSAQAKATIDREMQVFYQAISTINLQIGTIQIRSFQQQLELSEKMQRNQYVIVALMLVMLVLAVVYGRRITRRMDRDAQKLDNAHQQVVDTARQAGMAEIATGVLHNVGNVLNSVNVSATVVTESLKKSKVGSVSRLAGLFEQNEGSLGDYFTKDEKGRQVPGFIRTLAGHLDKEREDMVSEMNALAKSIQHIKSIISMQQSYAKVGGVSETSPVLEIVEDAIRLNAVSLQRHDIQLNRHFETKEEITVERHKVLQILVNLMRNSKDALDKVDGREKIIDLRVFKDGEDSLGISVKDNGIGFGGETGKRLFQHGFTTCKEGHGFGLHSGALAAKEMGGKLSADSEGEGKGAAFTLTLPMQPPVLEE